jgi:hypothetical protein
MSTTVLVGWGDEDRFADAIWSSDADPMESYQLTDFGFRNPAERVVWEGTDLVLTATLMEAILGDILVIPACNLDPGSDVLRLTNAEGLDLAVTVPQPYRNRIPRTIALDLTTLDLDDEIRTSDEWNLEVTGNSRPIAFGGLICLFDKRTITAMQWGLEPRRQQHANQVVNEYGTRYRTGMRTQTRALGYRLSVEPSELGGVEDWYDANEGLVQPGLLWVQASEIDPIVGTLDEVLQAKQASDSTGLYEIAGLFTELTKGKPFTDAALFT